MTVSYLEGQSAFIPSPSSESKELLGRARRLSPGHTHCIHGLGLGGRCLWELGQPHTKPTQRARILLSVGLVGVGYFWHQWVIRVGVAEKRTDGQEN